MKKKHPVKPTKNLGGWNLETFRKALKTWMDRVARNNA